MPFTLCLVLVLRLSHVIPNFIGSLGPSLETRLELSENNLELIDFPDPKLDTGLELIDCNDFSESKPETVIFSNPEPELDLIDFRDFSKLELELIDFSDPEFKLEYSPRLKATDTEMPLINDKLRTSLITAKRVFRSEYIDKVKISSSYITTEFFSGIFTENFFKPSAELGRVKVAKHNLEIKCHTSTLYASPFIFLVELEQRNSEEASRRDGTRREKGHLLRAKHG